MNEEKDTIEVSIEDLTTWSDEKHVKTKNGPRFLRTGPADSRFWDLWKHHKASLKNRGISCGKDRKTGQWQVCWWRVDEEGEKQEQETLKESRASSADIDLPKPDGLEYLPYQKAGIKYGLDRDAVLIGDEMGLGKTIQAIGIANADPEMNKILLVCPSSLKVNWKREFEKWTTRDRTFSIVAGKKPDRKAFAADVVIINYDILTSHHAAIHGTEWDALIVDEAHYLKNGKAKRTQAIVGKWHKEEAKRMPALNAKKRIFLTGTPLVNRPIEGWSLFHYLCPSEFRSFYRYSNRYCAAHHNGYGMDYSGSSNLDELQRVLRLNFMIRRLKKEVLKDLPAKTRQVLVLPENGVKESGEGLWDMEQTVEILQAQADALKDIDRAAYEEIVATLTGAKKALFQEMSRVRKETAIRKAPLVVEFVKNALEEEPGKKVILFGHHKAVIDILMGGLAEFNPVKITGDVANDKRQIAVDTFQNDPACQVFIGNMIAAGVGLTLTASSHVIFAELDWVPGNVSQAEDRAHRIGQKDSVLVQHLVLENSIDARLAEAIVEKQRVLDAALDNESKREAFNKPLESTFSVKRTEDEKRIAELNKDPERCAKILHAVQLIGSCCDGAQTRDGMGFAGPDVGPGGRIACMGTLNGSMALAGWKLVRKYRNQLCTLHGVPDMVAECGVDLDPKFVKKQKK